MNLVLIFSVECVKKYLDANCSGHIEFPQSFTDEPSFQKCRATMNSSARIDFLVSHKQPVIQMLSELHILHKWLTRHVISNFCRQTPQNGSRHTGGFDSSIHGRNMLKLVLYYAILPMMLCLCMDVFTQIRFLLHDFFFFFYQFTFFLPIY